MSNEEDIDDLREKRLQELQDRAEGQGDQAEAEQARKESAEAQKKAMLRQHLTDGARKRLNTVKMSKPEFGEQVEQQVLALARSGRVQGRIDEDQMKELLSELKPDSKSFNVKRR
ncbi:hypothetical protein L593_02715 [Salinarchaeum sp. Harcht-Bsk1]|uniref:DNA-binding protein n=1 Tax=Salinarchaeum sp. Harcht-Bsk1 TaxID=1333523 RepID=UPI0003422BD7|nr:DNA-binding protein [Salinarchaeum sp. Harcht-Bsk1]AGN00494.1 hypothetical protein L593_02715 [Salinarchaeum sp. Harcht-Bsk1]